VAYTVERKLGSDTSIYSEAGLNLDLDFINIFTLIIFRWTK